jgi:endonuclease/exonuclease/phosphatase family metal-dependent hydrolase
MTWNVQMWTDIKGRKNFNKVIKLVNIQKPDILFLQEVLSVNIKRFSEKTGMILQSFNENLTVKTSNCSSGNENIIYLTVIFTHPKIKVNYNYSKPFDENFGSDMRGYSVTQISIRSQKIYNSKIYEKYFFNDFLSDCSSDSLSDFTSYFTGAKNKDEYKDEYIESETREYKESETTEDEMRDTKKENIYNPLPDRNYICKINLVNLHLDPFDITENIRLFQINQIINDMKSQKISCIIAGDFNSVCKEDYENNHWNWLCRETLPISTKQISRIRSSTDVNITKSRSLSLEEIIGDIKSRTYDELPNKVITTLKNNGFVDSSNTSIYSCVYTCWTARKVDYIFHSDELCVKNHSVYFTKDSDHFPLLALVEF